MIRSWRVRGPEGQTHVAVGSVFEPSGAMDNQANREGQSGVGSFWSELRRRRVVRSGGMYVAAAFVVLQVGEIILPAFNTPDWALQSLVVVAVLGLPVVLAVAWVYDLTPAGFERTESRSAAVSAIPRLAFLVITSAAVGFAAFAYARITFSAPSAGAPEGVASFVSLDENAPISAIAVLPLDNFGAGDDFFARSLHEEIIAQLAELTTLRVVSRTSVERYADTDKLVPEIAQELRVQAIVEGSVTRPADSDTVRITIQLIHAPSDTHLMAETFEREARDVLRLQREVAQQIAEAIQGQVDAQDSQMPNTIAAVDPEAHEAFLMGRMEFDKSTSESLAAAAQYFREAISFDTSFSAAYAGLASAQLLMGLDGSAPMDDMLAEAHAEAERAVELGGATDEANAVLVMIQDHMEDLPEAIRAEVQTSLASVPDSFARSYLQNFTRVGARARRMSLADAQASPETVARSLLFNAQKRMGEADFGGAATLLQQAVETDPGAMPAWEALERTYVLQGDYAQAVEVRKDRLRSGEPGGPGAAADRLEALERTFDPDNPSTYWQWLRQDHDSQRARGAFASDVEYAAACVALGDNEDALAHLESALENRDPALHSLRFDPTWDPIRRDPRFMDISRKIRAARSEARRRPPRPGSRP